MEREKNEYTRAPEIDPLSQQIVDMMGNRKDENTRERLYKVGKEKLRQIAEHEKNKQPEEDPEMKIPTRGPDFDAMRRGKPLQEALYELHKEKMKQAELRKLEAYNMEDMRMQAEKFVNSESD
jgi:hypothetical protein